MLHLSEAISACILQVLLDVVGKEYWFCMYCHWQYVLPFGPRGGGGGGHLQGKGCKHWADQTNLGVSLFGPM